ncbi:hypothetical protein ACE83Q_00550 [Dellaglioa sp. P0083]|uniref:hypothetical protein n=1 Tax=Dellaglioa kimchii TaxID=3344667 RepID=UPI0038D4B5BC
MREYKNRKKEWVSATIMTSAVFAGLLAGGASHREPNVFAKTDESSMSSESSDETSSKLTIKESSELEKKVLLSESVENKSKIKAKSSEKTKLSTRSVTRAAGYIGPTKDVFPDDYWDTTKDYAAESATAFVSQSGSQNKPGEPVLYFGNKYFPFQMNELLNNDPVSGSNKPGWAYMFDTGINPVPRKSYGIIINNSVPGNRGYGLVSSYSSIPYTIESAVKGKDITGYQLFKNKTGTGFKAIMYDTKYKLSYTFEEVYDASGGVYSYFSITNNDTTARAVGAIEGVDTFVDEDAVTIESLGPDEGFKMVGSAHSLNFKLNDPRNNTKLGGWTNYTGGDIPNVTNTGHLNNYFNGGALGTGMEKSPHNKIIAVSDIKNPDNPFKGDSGFIIKANPKTLEPGGTLVTGSYQTYKEAVAPDASVKEQTINAYTSQTNRPKILGTVLDKDGSKGYIQITYPDGSTSGTTENVYDTGKVDTSADYSANIDTSKLKLGSNKIIVTAVDDSEVEQLKPVTVTVNLYKLGATAIPQTIKVGDAVKTGETDLINNLTIINQPTVNAHTLKIDATNPSGKPLINTKAGFYIQDMLLTDTVVKPNEIAKVAVPVTVTDSDTATDKVSALYAKGFGVKQVDIQKLTTDELTALIMKTSEAKGWLLATGAESKVSVDSTTLKQASTDGIYQAVIKNSDGLKKTINIEVTGGLKITEGPGATNYGSFLGVTLPYSGEDFKVQRSDPDPHVNSVQVSNAGKQAWTLTAQLTTPLTEHNDANVKLNGVLTYIDASGQSQDIESNSAEVGSGQSEVTQEVSWASDKGIIVQLNGKNPSLKAGDYTGELTWTLADTPHS